MRIALSADARYLPWVATAITSALRSNPSARLHFDLLHEGSVTASDERQLRDMVSSGGGTIVFHASDARRLDALPSMGRLGRATWLRLLLPELLPEVDRVLYLDADTLVVDSLDPLWRTELGGMPFAAVANVVEPALHGHVAELGINDPANVFNGGVLLMDLDVWRAAGAVERIVRYASTSGVPLLWADQSALNAVFAGEWVHLHPRWNAQNSFWTWRPWAEEVFGTEAIRTATDHPAIVHFEGPILAKPWHYLCQHPWVGEYRATLALTPWAETPVEDRTVATRAIRRLPPSTRLPVYLRLLRARARARRLLGKEESVTW